ncbi:MAG: DUF3299 domain-containing protein [Gammaproteobacteria bacterium]
MNKRSWLIAALAVLALFSGALAQAFKLPLFGDEEYPVPPIKIGWDALLQLDYKTGAVPAALKSLDGATVDVPGFMVPLENDSPDTVQTFLLVPSYGYCIHVPPPPPNQMVYVELDEGVPFNGLSEPVWVTGRFKISPAASSYGAVSFSLEGRKVRPYGGPNN